MISSLGGGGGGGVLISFADMNVLMANQKVVPVIG